MPNHASHVSYITKYEYSIKHSVSQVDVNCHQALLSVFKGRLGDVKDKDTAVERCECHIQEQPDKSECRLIVKMVCRHGMYIVHFSSARRLNLYKSKAS